MRVLLALPAGNQREDDGEALWWPLHVNSNSNRQGPVVVADGLKRKYIQEATGVASLPGDNNPNNDDEEEDANKKPRHYSALSIPATITTTDSSTFDDEEDCKPPARPTIRKPPQLKMGYRDESREQPEHEEYTADVEQPEHEEYTADVSNITVQSNHDVAVSNHSTETPISIVETTLSTSSTWAQQLKSRGLEINPQEGDGNCFFRAVSLQVYGDATMHYEVRQRCCDFMAKDEAHFSQFINDEIFADYVERKRQDGVHANNPEIQAIAELFSRPVEVYTEESGPEPINIFQSDYKDQFPIRLSYHDGNHYNAIVDPLVPTAGLGLGMPGLKPGLADKLQLSKAIIRSDEDEDVERALKESCQTANSQQSDDLQRALKESAMADNRLETAIFKSDVDATNFELEQAVLESSIGGKIPARPYLPIAFSSTPSVASIPADVPLVASLPSSEVWSEEYPPTVQELVMNGFEIQKVVRAYELIGDSFDDLLAFLVSNQSS